MPRLFSLALGLAALTGCIIVDDDGPDTVIVEQPNVPNSAPYVFDGAAGCYYDSFYGDDIIWLSAWVDDVDGLRDVTQVWADIYDDRSGALVQSLELFPGGSAQEWFSDWLVSTTAFDCFYPFYSIDLVAYDRAESYGVLTIFPSTY
jgi:hypothetical protein